jgi:hypothetical protein
MDEEFVDYGDEYDDEEYGSQEAKYFYEQQRAANAAMIEGSGGSQEYDEEDISDESGLLRQQFMAQQMAQAKAQQANARGFAKMG